LLAQNWKGFTVFQLEVKNSHLETLHKMCVWTEEAQLNAKELKNKLLLAKRSIDTPRVTDLP